MDASKIKIFLETSDLKIERVTLHLITGKEIKIDRMKSQIFVKEALNVIEFHGTEDIKDETFSTVTNIDASHVVYISIAGELSEDFSG